MAQSCVEAGYEVTLIHSDAYLGDIDIMAAPGRAVERLVETVANTSPDLVGVGAWTYHMPFVIEWTTAFKRTYPEVPIILGGLNATFLPAHTLSVAPAVDLVVRGEGHRVFPNLLTALNERTPLSKVRGLSFRRDEADASSNAAGETEAANSYETNALIDGVDPRQYHHTPPAPITEDLDTLPIIDFSYLDERVGNFFTVQTSIGCPHHCSFCCVHDLYGRYKQHSIAFVDEQLRTLESQFGDIYVQFLDDYALCNLNRAAKLLDMIENDHPSLCWELLTRIESIDDRMAQRLARAGCVGAWLGFESMIPETLRFYNKTRQPQRYIRQLDTVMDAMETAQIFTAVPFLLGAPNETVDDYRATRAFAARIDEEHDYIFSCLGLVMVYPHTTLWSRLQKGEISLFKLSDRMPVAEAPFDEQYRDEHPLAPNYWMIENRTMSNDALEETVLRYAKEAVTTRFLRGDIHRLTTVRRK